MSSSLPLLADAELPDLPAGGHHGAGHRARLRERLLNTDGTGLHDHEIVEYLLTLAIPRRDTKPLAKQLIDHFGSLAGVLTADGDSLRAVPGMGETSAAALKIVQVAARRLVSEPVRRQPILSSWQALLDYLRLDMAHLTRERVRVLFLNAKNMLISDDVMSEGSVDQAAIYTRQVIKRALELSATALILVHNHPSGDPTPSQADIQMTKAIIDIAKPLGISVHDHIIVGKNGHASLKGMRLI